MNLEKTKMIQANPDAIAIADLGSFTTKIKLWRLGQILAHFIPASCDRIDADKYTCEAKEPPAQWGSGVVCCNFSEGDRNGQ